MSGQVSPFPAQSGSCLAAGDTVGHFSARPCVPLGKVASWGRGEWEDVPGHQQSTFSLVPPLLSSFSVTSFSGQRQAALPSVPLSLRPFSSTVHQALLGILDSALSKTCL